MPRVTTIPSAKWCRIRAGSVRRFLSSIVCSCSPRSIQGAFAISTFSHDKPHRPTWQPLSPPQGVFPWDTSVSLGAVELARVGAAAAEDGRAAAGREPDRLVDRLPGREGVGEAGGKAVAAAV